MRIRLLAAIFACATLASPAHAERSIRHTLKACGMTGTPASIVADVYDDTAPGTLLHTIPNGEVTQVGTTDCYQVDLASGSTATAISYPAGGLSADKGYTLIFRSDVAGETVSYDIEVLGTIGAGTGVDDACVRRTPVYTTTTIPTRGITQQVIQRGMPSYIQVDIDCSRAFTSPVTFYEVMRYNADGLVESRTPADAVPNP